MKNITFVRFARAFFVFAYFTTDLFLKPFMLTKEMKNKLKPFVFSLSDVLIHLEFNLDIISDELE